MKNLAGKHVLVLGLGHSGLALARWCARYGARVTVADTRSEPPQGDALRANVHSASFVHGEMTAALLDGVVFDMLLKSPGLSPVDVLGVTAAAQTRSMVCSNELGLFAQALVDLKEDTGYAPKVIGITGTNGKTTVTSLAGQLVQRAGKSVAVAGNIGPTLLDTLAEKIDTDSLPEVWVLELSSFQLDGIKNFEPDAATVLNITQDHLDWHHTFKAYATAKNNVYGPSGLMLLNRNDALVMAVTPVVSKGKPARCYLTFGHDEPQRPGDYGVETVNGMAWLVRASEADETIKRKRGDKNEEVELHIQRLMPVDALRIHGLHNATNALAALALTHAVGCALGPMLHGLREYKGEPHRVESVAVINGVEYFDDSKGTNVGATVAALAGLGAQRKLVVILGGIGKDQDFFPLAIPVSRYARSVILIGRDATLIAAALETSEVTLHFSQSMQEAVSLAAQQAQTGDAVLMSPACASFDMFDNYEHRARIFREAVHALALEEGVLL
ncbi:MAG: UDP-N-acetylmuramoyl-L-alanine--D-glutamate ligase [Polaromonas sp.]|nr:UDP-N-acetylmuramoyl-L-alanine--D-glutamate ligase [Polaromonas sp.]